MATPETHWMDERGDLEPDSTDADFAPATLPALRPARLLLAEEDAGLRRSLAVQLRGRGYEVDEAISGYEALALLTRQGGEYDLVITDLALSGMNGLELIDELRNQGRGAQVPAIVLGEQPGAQVEREAHRLRAVLIDKGLGVDRLWQRAENLAGPVQSGGRPGWTSAD